MEAKFWRLLSDYENLTEDETVALRERNFSYFSSIRGTKAQILPELLDLAESSGIRKRDQGVRQRIAKIVETGRANIALLESCLAANAVARQNAQTAVRRLKCLNRIYSDKFSNGAHTAYAA